MIESNLFPVGPELDEILNLQTSADLRRYLGRSLTEPLQNLFARPRKNIRCDLVKLGFRIAERMCKGEKSFDFERNLPLACEILEILHAGSLIIDDIEDGTKERRGQRALHLQYGVPVALNAGNWLYFLPFQKIDQMPISPEAQNLVSKACQRTLLRAHYGQALDVGVSIDSVEQSSVDEICLATMELKSGVLTGFALQLGFLTVGHEASAATELENWGRRLGLALQMFDDIGNLSSHVNPEKRGEDLKLFRPSYVFAVAAEILSPHLYAEFIGILKSGQSVNLAIDFLKAYRVHLCAQEKARANLQRVNEDFEKGFTLKNFEKELLFNITQKLVTSYE